MTRLQAVRAAYLRGRGWTEEQATLYAPSGRWLPSSNDVADLRPDALRAWVEFMDARRR
jgi:hypothetical protein